MKDETRNMGPAPKDERGPDDLCRYSAIHYMEGVPATTVIDCGVVGMIPACQRCADFYRKMSGQ